MKNEYKVSLYFFLFGVFILTAIPTMVITQSNENKHLSNAYCEQNCKHYKACKD